MQVNTVVRNRQNLKQRSKGTINEKDHNTVFQHTNGIHDLKAEELPVSRCIDEYGVAVKVIVPQLGVDVEKRDTAEHLVDAPREIQIPEGNRSF